MKGYRFYLEYRSTNEKRSSTIEKLGDHMGNVIALTLDDNNRPIWYISDGTIIYEGFSAVFFYPNSDVNFGGVGAPYLEHFCKRIPEHLARQIHPRLFERLDE